MTAPAGVAEITPAWLAWAGNRSGSKPARDTASAGRERPTYVSTTRAPESSLAARAYRLLRQPEAPPEDVWAAADAIANPDLGWDDFNRLSMAFWAASAGAAWGLEALQRLSAKSKKHNEAENVRRWQHFSTSPPTDIGYGALVFEARKTEPDWEPPSRRPKEVVPEPEHRESEAGKVNGHSSLGSIFPESSAFNKADPDNPLIELNKKHCVIADIGGKCLVMSWVPSKIDPSVKVPSFQTFKSFSERYGNRYVLIKDTNAKGEVTEKAVQLGSHYLKWTKRRSYEGIDLVPGGEAVLPGNVLNLWTGFGVVATGPGGGDTASAGRGWPLMQRHILEVLAGGDAVAAAYIARFAAWAVQHPGERAEVALVFRGGKGSGKGTFANAMVRLFGQHGLQIYNSKHLVGNFNGHLRNCILLFADEAFWAGDRAGESVLKGMLTEPTLVIEQKGIDATPWRNMTHVIMAANAEWVVPSSHDERRFAMFDVSDSRVGDRAYFEALHAELAGGGLAAMLWDLMRVDLGAWHPRQILHTEALRQQKSRSMDPRWEWWEEMLQDGMLPHTDGFPGRARAGALFEHFKGSAGAWRGANQTMLGRFMREVGAFSLHTENGNIWQFPELNLARASFERRYGKWEWRSDLAKWLDRTAYKPRIASSLQQPGRT